MQQLDGELFNAHIRNLASSAAGALDIMRRAKLLCVVMLWYSRSTSFVTQPSVSTLLLNSIEASGMVEGKLEYLSRMGPVWYIYKVKIIYFRKNQHFCNSKHRMGEKTELYKKRRQTHKDIIWIISGQHILYSPNVFS